MSEEFVRFYAEKASSFWDYGGIGGIVIFYDKKESLWNEITDRFPELVKDYTFTRIIINEIEPIGKLYSNELIGDKEVFEFIKDMSFDDKQTVISLQFSVSGEEFLTCGNQFDNTVNFMFLILSTMDLTEETIEGVINYNKYVHFNVEDLLTVDLAITSALFKLFIERGDTEGLRNFFDFHLRQASGIFKNLVIEFLKHIKFERQHRYIDLLENFISEKLHTDKMNTYYSMFYYVVTSYNNNMEEESIKNLAIWALNREDVTLENIFTTIYDNVAKTVLLGHFPEERIYTLFKGFYDAGLSADVIRNYSQEGEDWYLEDILGASDV